MELVFFIWNDVIKHYSGIEALAMVKVDVGNDINEISEGMLLYKYKKQVLSTLNAKDKSKLINAYIKDKNMRRLAKRLFCVGYFTDEAFRNKEAWPLR